MWTITCSDVATFRLRHLSDPAVLKAMRPDNLVAILKPYKARLSELRFELPIESDDELDVDALVKVLGQPDAAPPQLLDRLMAIDELATPERMADLLAGAKSNVELAAALERLGDDPTPADVAATALLHAPESFERLHAEARIDAKRSLQYFRADRDESPTPKEVTSELRRRLEQRLAVGFAEAKLGQHCQVFDFQRKDGLWLVIRRGNAYRREGTIDPSGASSVCFRPECYDTIKFDSGLGELCVPPESKAVSGLYREAIGEILFGDKALFSGDAKYRLDPLYEQGLASITCADIEGIEAIRLQELRLSVDGPYKLVLTLRAHDLFAHFHECGQDLPRGVRTLHAKFAVTFTGAKQPRVVTVRPPNSASYTRTADAAVVENWLAARGFVVSQARDG